MRTGIIEKLTNHMAALPEREADVVYALVQVRKVLESEGRKESFENLYFFCDWVVHARLNRKSAQKTVDLLEQQLCYFDSRHPESMDRGGLAHEFMSLRWFRQELGVFCIQHELPATWTSEYPNWCTVALLYSHVILDCPLIILRDDHPTRYLHQVAISSHDLNPAVVRANPHWRVTWTWQFTLNDGTKFHLQYQAGS